MDAARAVLSALAVARMEKNLKQRQPVRQIVVATGSELTRKALKTYSSLMLEQANTRFLRGIRKTSAARYETASKAQRFAKAEFADGTVYIDLKLTQKELADGLARDAVRRLQQMRKEMDLKVDSYVHAYVLAPSRKSASLLNSKRGYIAHEIRAKKLIITTEEMDVSAPYYTKIWQIDEENYQFSLCESSLVKTKA